MHSIELKDIPCLGRDLVVSLAAREASEVESRPPVQMQYHHACTLEEASILCRGFIARHKLDGKTWAGGHIIERGEIIGRVAHSGRIWAAIPATVRRVATRFSELLFEHVGADNMREIALRNAAETAACVCHTHDFTDANMLMLEAMVNVVGRHANDDSPAMLWLFDVAWHHARMTWLGPLELGAPRYLLVAHDGAQLELHGPYGDEDFAQDRGARTESREIWTVAAAPQGRCGGWTHRAVAGLRRGGCGGLRPADCFAKERSSACEDRRTAIALAWGGASARHQPSQRLVSQHTAAPAPTRGSASPWCYDPRRYPHQIEGATTSCQEQWADE